MKNRLAELILKESRQRNKKLTYKTISQATGIPACRIGRMVSKINYRINDNDLSKFCDFFKVNTHDIIFFETQTKNAPPAVELQKEC